MGRPKRREPIPQYQSTPPLGGPRWAPLAVLAAAVLLVFGQVATFSLLHWDDTAHITENPFIRQPTYFLTHAFQNIYMPLTFGVWSLLHGAFGAWAAPYHLTNLLLHLGNALLVFWLLLRVAAFRKLRQPALPALAGALVFALHPLQAEPVSWVTSLKDLLSAFFCFVALHAYLSHLVRPRLAPVLLAFVLALGSKAFAVNLVWIVLVLGLWMGRPPRRLVRDLAPLVLLSIAFLLMNAISQGEVAMPIVAPWYLRPIVALDSLGTHLSHLLVPWPLLPSYGRSLRFVLQSGVLWWSWIPAAFALAAALVLRRRVPELLAGLGIFVGTLLLVSGLLSFPAQNDNTVSDRYAYLGMLGPALLVCCLVGRLARPRAMVAWVALLGVTLGGMSAVQARIWRDEEALWSHNLEHLPDAPVALINLAVDRARGGRLRDAEALYRRTLEVAPHEPLAHDNLGSILVRTGRAAEAERLLERGLEQSPGHPGLSLHLARLRLGRGALRGVGPLLETVLRARPLHHDANVTRGELLLRQGRFAECARHMRPVVARHPDDPEARLLLAVSLASSGALAEAIQEFRRVLALDPGNAQARQNLERALADQRRRPAEPR